MKAVGRPPQIDKNGEHIVRTTINVSVPVKLLEFLKREKISRSKLFNKVVTLLHEKHICPKCYTTDVVNNHMGIRCNGACSRYQPYFYKKGKCDKCKIEFQGPSNLPIRIEDEYNIESFICEVCNVDSK